MSDHYLGPNITSEAAVHDDRITDLEADVDELLATVARLWQALTAVFAALALLAIALTAWALA